MIKILIVDDHKIFRDGLVSIFEQTPDIAVVGEASNGAQVLNILSTTPTDVILMDINMGQSDGIGTTQIVKEKYPQTKVLMLSMHNESGFIVKSVEAGAVGYLLKNAGKDETIRAIKAVYNGETYYSSEVSSKLLAHINQLNKNKTGVRLTKRETEILQLIAEEYSNPEIAEKLFISIRTVDTHRRNLLEKLGAKNTAGLVKHAIKIGLLDL